MKSIRIAGREIGDGFPCFIIAEAGSNHNGDLRKAYALIDVAARAKADAVKFQTFRAEKLYLKTAGQSAYLKSKRSIFDIIKAMEMPEFWIPKLARHCKKRGILFLSTATDPGCVDLLDPYVPAYKISSYEMTATPLVEYIAKKKKPVILSTGAANMNEVREAVRVLKNAGNSKIAIMQCTAKYPTPLDFINARSILAMKKALGVPVGLSDHSREYDVAPMTAVALGANLIEKHFTLSNDLPGPDHRFAVEPDELEGMVQKIRNVEECLGSGVKRTLSVEKELRGFARQSIFAVRDILKGECFTPKNIATLRCGNRRGFLSPAQFKNILGRISRRSISSQRGIMPGDFAS